jgi:hypothetical protein
MQTMQGEQKILSVHRIIVRTWRNTEATEEETFRNTVPATACTSRNAAMRL